MLVLVTQETKDILPKEVVAAANRRREERWRDTTETKEDYPAQHVWLDGKSAIKEFEDEHAVSIYDPLSVERVLPNFLELLYEDSPNAYAYLPDSPKRGT